MSANVFLVPIDPENFDRTVQSAVDLTLSTTTARTLSPTSTKSVCGPSTTTAGTARRSSGWKKGDLLLFYHDGEYLATGRVGTAFEDEDRWVSSTFWTAFPTTRVYTITDFTAASAPKRAVNTIFDYSASYTPGFMRVADSRVNAELSSIESAIEHYTKRNA